MLEIQIPTNSELTLNKQIAEKQGWRVYVFTVHSLKCAQLFKPGDRWVKTYWERDYADVEIAAWLNAPQYTTDWNAFMDLIGDDYFNSGRRQVEGKLFWFSWDSHSEPMWGETRLIAGCNAWLKREQETQ